MKDYQPDNSYLLNNNKENIKHMIEDITMDKQTIASICGVSPATITGWSKGEYQPTKENFNSLLRLYIKKLPASKLKHEEISKTKTLEIKGNWEDLFFLELSKKCHLAIDDENKNKIKELISQSSDHAVKEKASIEIRRQYKNITDIDQFYNFFSKSSEKITFYCYIEYAEELHAKLQEITTQVKQSMLNKSITSPDNELIFHDYGIKSLGLNLTRADFLSNFVFDKQSQKYALITKSLNMLYASQKISPQEGYPPIEDKFVQDDMPTINVSTVNILISESEKILEKLKEKINIITEDFEKLCQDIKSKDNLLKKENEIINYQFLSGNENKFQPCENIDEKNISERLLNIKKFNVLIKKMEHGTLSFDKIEINTLEIMNAIIKDNISFTPNKKTIQIYGDLIIEEEKFKNLKIYELLTNDFIYTYDIYDEIKIKSNKLDHINLLKSLKNDIDNIDIKKIKSKLIDLGYVFPDTEIIF